MAEIEEDPIQGTVEDVTKGCFGSILIFLTVSAFTTSFVIVLLT